MAWFKNFVLNVTLKESALMEEPEADWDILKMIKKNQAITILGILLVLGIPYFLGRFSRRTRMGDRFRLLPRGVRSMMAIIVRGEVHFRRNHFGLLVSDAVILGAEHCSVVNSRFYLGWRAEMQPSQYYRAPLNRFQGIGLAADNFELPSLLLSELNPLNNELVPVAVVIGPVPINSIDMTSNDLALY